MAVIETFRMVLSPPHRVGYPFIAGAAALWLIGLFVGFWIDWLGFLALLFCLYFFRDPERVPPDRPGLVVAPADGTVVSVQPAVPPYELGLGDTARWRVAIFLSALDVHVNRMPVEGTITRITPFGAFVQISPAVEALVHISELGGGNDVDPEKIFTLNERKEFTVLDVDKDNRKISLSLNDKKKK